MGCEKYPTRTAFALRPVPVADQVGGLVGAAAYAAVDGDAVAFSSAGSFDTLGPATEAWDFGDASSSSPAPLGTSPSHIYPAPGSYDFTLTVTDTGTGRTATASGTVTIAASGPIAVDHVAVTPPSLNGHVGGSGSASAVAYDASGHILSGQTFTWTSDNHTVAADPANGPTATVPYLAVGTANLQAHVGPKDSNVVPITVSDTVVVTPPAVGGPVTPNLPGGFSTLFEWKCNGVPPSDLGVTSGYGLTAGYLRWHNYLPDPMIVAGSDASAPVDPSGVISELFPAGLQSGAAAFSENCWVDAAISEYSKVYMCRYVRIPGATFECEGSGLMKLFGFAPCGRKASAGQGGADNNVILGVSGSGLATALKLTVLQQGVPGIRNMISASAPFTAGGVWHRIEWLLEINTVGSANGQVHIWVDGTLCLSFTDVTFRTATYAHKFFNLGGPRVWGGNAGGAKRQTDRFETAYVYVAGQA